MNREVMIKALNVIKDSVINTDFPLTNKLADAIYAIDFELSKALKPVAWAAKSVYGGYEGLSFDKQPRFDIPLYALEGEQA